MIGKIKEFLRLERDQADVVDFTLMGYRPYSSFRRREFENSIASGSFSKIARSKLHLRRMLFPLRAWPATGRSISLVNKDEKVIRPTGDVFVLGYYADGKVGLHMEAVRFWSYAVGVLLLPFFLARIPSSLSMKRKVLFVGEAVYFRACLMLLSVLKPTEINMSVYYSNMALVAAAKRLGINVIEHQHGAITMSHIGYVGVSKDVLPDRIVTLNPFWGRYIERVGWPLDPDKVPTGWLKDVPALLTSQIEKDTKILVIGQETVHDLLFNAHTRLSSLGFDTQYRFHPRMQKNEQTLDEQLAWANLVVGSYSTVLIDAHLGGKSVALLDNEMSAFLDPLLGEEDVFRLVIDT